MSQRTRFWFRYVALPLTGLIAILAIVVITFLSPAVTGAQTVKTPSRTTHPHVASARNHYSDAQVAAKLAKMNVSVIPLDLSGGYVASTSWPVIFVHGFSQQSKSDCNGSWGTAKSYLQSNGWHGSIIKVGYYGGDTNCDVALGNYAGNCTGYYAGNQGTNNESIRHIACELAWYIWDNFTQYGRNVQLVGHSMGGLIIRWALYATPFDPNLPPYIGVQDVVTFATPHAGIPVAGAAFFICFECLQAQEMRNNNAFMVELTNYGQNPQGAGWGTDWSIYGSSCESWYNIFDPGVDWHSSLGMYSEHKVEFLNPPCYDHGGYLPDTSNSDNLTVHWSSNSGSDAVGNTSATWAHSLHAMLMALSSASY